MNKAFLIQEIIKALNLELAGYDRSARSAHAEATDEQSKAENKYDTRGLEASYLARGQSLQAAEVLQSIEILRTFELRDFDPKEPVALGALVKLSSKSENAWYFVTPRAGGTEVRCDGAMVMTITPNAPLGQQLVGKKAGAQIKTGSGPFAEQWRIAEVQ